MLVGVKGHSASRPAVTTHPGAGTSAGYSDGVRAKSGSDIDYRIFIPAMAAISARCLWLSLVYRQSYRELPFGKAQFARSTTVAIVTVNSGWRSDYVGF